MKQGVPSFIEHGRPIAVGALILFVVWAVDRVKQPKLHFESFGTI